MSDDRCDQCRAGRSEMENEWLRARIMRALGILIEERNRDKAERILSAALVGGRGE